MAADRLQLADDRLRAVPVEAVGCPDPELAETLERLALAGERDLGRVEDRPREERSPR